MELVLESLDRAAALASVGGDKAFLAELAGIMGAACPTLLESTRASLAAGNLAAAARTAHLLRVAAENVAARGVASAALALETIAQHRRREAVEAAYSALRQEVEWLTPVLADLEREAAWAD